MPREMKCSLSPAAIEARRDLSAVLRNFRTTTGLTMQKLEQKTGISLARISAYERALALPQNSEISKYIGIALQTGYFPGDILEAFARAEDAEKGLSYVSPNVHAFEHGSEQPLSDVKIECEILEQAAENSKALLGSARWLPSRAQIRIDKLDYWQEILAANNDITDYLLCNINACNLLPVQEEKLLCQLTKGQDEISHMIKEHCTSLAKEAQALLTRYKKIGEVFDVYAGDLPGYALVKNQFYLGMTLEEILLSEQYTRRWAQTLQTRTLQIFQDRVGNIYDKRRAGA